MIPDYQLTARGLSATGGAPVLLLACGALAREILDLKSRNGWDHLDLMCLPAILHNSPQDIVPAVRAAVARHRAAYDSIFVVYADCGTGGLLRAACDEMGVAMVEGPHCYSFFEGNAAFAAHGEGTTFWLTDFLVRQFDAFVWRPLGLDRHPQLRDSYFGNYTTLTYLAQTDDPALDLLARQHATRLDLAYCRLFTGYGDLQPALASLARRNPTPR